MKITLCEHLLLASQVGKDTAMSMYNHSTSNKVKNRQLVIINKLINVVISKKRWTYVRTDGEIQDSSSSSMHVNKLNTNDTS